MTNNKTKIRIGIVYNPQENKTTKDELKEVYGRIKSEIKNARKMEQHIIIMGDMNCKTGDLIDGSDIKGKKDYDKNYKRKQYDHPK